MPFKDLPEGTTHYENDGCGEPAHNPFPPKTSPNCPHLLMGKKYDESRGCGNGPTHCLECKKTLKELLSDEFQRGISEERERVEEIVKTCDMSTWGSEEFNQGREFLREKILSHLNSNLNNMPTHEEKIAEIRAACIKVNPEIVELKFGCLVQRMADPAILDMVVEIKSGVHYPHWVTLRREGVVGLFSWECNTSEIETWKISGRPIRLSDVLKTIDNGILSCLVSYKGEFYFEIEQPHWTGIRWDLSQDDLSLQSPETITFIHSLI